jgi:hypothetical protein
MKTWFRAFSIFALTVLFAFNTLAQSHGILNGHVLDALNKQGLAGWTVEVKSANFSEKFRTDSQGYFIFREVPIGLCNVRAVSPVGQMQTIHEVRISNIKPSALSIEVHRSTDLDEVAVVATAFHTTTETPLGIKNISWSEMQRMPGSVMDLSKVIQSFPGVLPKASFGYNISLRGGNPSENAYLLDGIVLPTVNHFSIQGASGGAVSLINLDHIQGMELIAGAFPIHVGDALSGVLNLEGRNARSDRWGSKWTLGSTDYGVTFEGPVGNNTLVTASVRNSFSQHYFKLFNIPVLPTYQDAQLRIHHKINASSDLTVIGLGGWDSYKLYLEGRGSDALLYNVGYIPEGEQTTEVVGARYRKFTDNGRWELVISQDAVSNQAKKFIGNSDLEQDKQMDYLGEERNRRMNIKHEVEWGSLTWSYGAGWVNRQQDFDIWQLRHNGQAVDTAIIQSSLSVNSLSAYTQVSQHFMDNKLMVSAGIRTEISDLNASLINPLKQLSPRMAMSYHLSQDWSLNANLGQYRQLPSAILLAANHANNQDEFVASTQVRQGAIGLEFQNGQTYRVSIETYYKAYDHAPFLTESRIPFANAIGAYVAVGDQMSSPDAEGRAYGMELFLQQKLKGSYWWMASYNLGHSDARKTGEQWAPSVWDSRHYMSLTWGKVWGKGWQFGAKWRYSSGTAYTAFDSATSSLKDNWDLLQRGIFDYANVSGSRLGGFSMLDIRWDKTYARKHHSYTWFIDLQNVMSSNVPLMPYLTVVRDANGDPMTNENDPSRYALKRVQSDTGRLLPTIGMIWEF